MEPSMHLQPTKSMREKVEEYAVDMDLPLLFIDGHDNAILGIARCFNKESVLYDQTVVLDNLMKDMTYDEALEYFEFNVIGAFVGEHTPTFVNNLFDY